MAFSDGLKDKVLKLGSKQKLGAIMKYVDNPSEDVRMAAAMALGMIPSYDSGMALIPLLRDSSPMVRASACESAATINANANQMCDFTIVFLLLKVVNDERVVLHRRKNIPGNVL